MVYPRLKNDVQIKSFGNTILETMKRGRNLTSRLTITDVELDRLEIISLKKMLQTVDISDMVSTCASQQE